MCALAGSPNSSSRPSGVAPGSSSMAGRDPPQRSRMKTTPKTRYLPGQPATRHAQANVHQERLKALERQASVRCEVALSFTGSLLLLEISK